jgi:hypothetical protein
MSERGKRLYIGQDDHPEWSDPDVVHVDCDQSKPNFGSIEARLSKGHVTGQRPSKEEIQAKMEKAKQMESSPVPSNPHPMYDWPEPYDWAKQGI